MWVCLRVLRFTENPLTVLIRPGLKELCSTMFMSRAVCKLLVQKPCCFLTSSAAPSVYPLFHISFRLSDLAVVAGAVGLRDLTSPPARLRRRLFPPLAQLDKIRSLGDRETQNCTHMSRSAFPPTLAASFEIQHDFAIVSSF